MKRENYINTKKVLMLGLDNAGKTSICLIFRKKRNLLSYLSLKPTRKINVQNFTTPRGNISIFDFGGQGKFRKDYLGDFSRYLAKTEKIIYVIDVQAFERYEESLDYLTKIVEHVKKESVPIDFSIFLHKYDPYITDIKKFVNIDEHIYEGLIVKIQQIFPSDVDYDIFKTCIFASFEKTMV